ncbi:MAG: zinc-ribbon domain-containing protein [Bacilli bacterium]
MFCTNCGKEISENDTFCPNCGAKQLTAQYDYNPNGYVNKNVQPSVQKESYNTMCIVGLVISCISLFINFWGLVGIAGTIVSAIGLSSCCKKRERGKTLAIIGIVIGVVSIIYFSIFYGLLVIISLI